MNAMIKYDEACSALAAARAVDEVADIRNKADAMRIYARQAKNRDLEIDAAQIRVRAERKLGELIKAQKDSVGLAKGGRPTDKTCSDEEQVSKPVTLEEAGIDRKLSSRAQRTAEIGEIRFEALMAMMRDQARNGEGRVMIDVLRLDSENEQRENRRTLARDLSDATAPLPTGRKFPCVYADPAWRRKQGITNRSYENHYATMSWEDICALPVADLLLPDAWVFLWVPRAHLLALHPVPMEFADDAGVVITRTVKLPLAWAVARAWGCDAYSTCFIWTKTDEDNPDDQGAGIIAYDQDEVLCLFKRGRGLPKPTTTEKFGSNHRERKREHSRKPDHYRDMIRAMTGGLPVLELFARVDEDHPLPEGWTGWGNQAGTTTPAFAPLDAACCKRDTAIVAAPAACQPHCIDSTDCASADVCAAVAAVADPAPPPRRSFVDLAIPAFLRRSKDNKLPSEQEPT